MSVKAIQFQRNDTRVNVSDPTPRQYTTHVVWTVTHPEGCGLALTVSARGIDTVGGVPAFDTQREETAWRWQVEMAIVALRFIKQGGLVPPDDQLLALAASVKDPE